MREFRRAVVIDWLQQDQRLSYRALKRQFALDDDYLEDLKVELIEVRQVAVDQDGKILVWRGAAAAEAPTAPPQHVPLTYTPSHLAEQILTSRSALEGERKQVTVLFADLKGSMELLAERTLGGDSMHPDPQVVIWPDYQEFYRWLCQEVDGLTDAELDFDSHDPAHEWMWWSIRRQVSHMAWDLLIVMYRRCHMFLWPDGNIPTPIRWEDHRLGTMQYDRVLDEHLFWRLEVLLDKVKLGVDWATQVVTTVPVETLRSTTSRHRGTPFWRHVIQVLPRGAWVDEHDPQFMHFTLEASLWMLYYEVLTHLYTIQRLKRAQGLPTRVVLPRVGYLTLPEYTGEATSSGPSFVPLR